MDNHEQDINNEINELLDGNDLLLFGVEDSNFDNVNINSTLISKDMCSIVYGVSIIGLGI